MKNLLSLVLLIVSLTAWPQNPYSGKIIDAKTKKPVAYAGFKMKFSRLQLMANVDGRYEITAEMAGKIDSVTVSCVGYNPRTLTLKKLMASAVTELEPVMYQLNTVDVKDRGNVDYPYQLFDELAQKYRKSGQAVYSKGYFYFLSRNDTIPLELTEEYFSGESSCSDGITKLTLKNGRLGFCLSKFYSLCTSDILTHITLFSLSGNPGLPFSPGNYAYHRLKKLYDIRIAGITGGKGNEKLILEFKPRKDSTDLFSGYAWVNRSDKTIEKLEYHINVGDFFYLRPAILGDRTDSIRLTLVYILDNSVRDTPRIARASLEYSLLYFSKSHANTIRVSSEGNLMLYDAGDPFPPTLPDGLIREQANDYQRISCLPYDSVFWSSQQITPQSERQKWFVDYFTANGVLVNFSRSLDSIAGSNFIRWSGTSGVAISDLFNRPPVVHVSANGSAAYNLKNPTYYDLDCRILVNPVVMADTLHLNSVTLLNKVDSYYLLGRRSRASLFLNLNFDLYEKQRREIITRCNKASAGHKLSMDELRSVYNEEMNLLKGTLKTFQAETKNGVNTETLLKWANDINRETGIDRSALVQKVLREEAVSPIKK